MPIFLDAVVGPVIATLFVIYILIPLLIVTTVVLLVVRWIVKKRKSKKELDELLNHDQNQADSI